jgi:formylmethanofuran dehydrogenase subunit D
VKLKTKQDENVPQSTILIPISIWANQLTGTEGNEVIYKNISVEVEPTRDPILSFEALISLIKE